MVLKGKEEDHEVLEYFFLPRGLGSRRDFAGKKRGERTLAGGPGEGATWLWINWRSWRRHGAGTKGLLRGWWGTTDFYFLS